MLGIAVPLRDERGVLSGFIGASTDITHQKQAASDRENLIAQLEARNVELERFTYTVSHDLKSPLVTIKGFLGLLMDDAAKGHAERVQRDIEHISNAADKMGTLLSELLELSRIGRTKPLAWSPGSSAPAGLAWRSTRQCRRYRVTGCGCWRSFRT